MEADSYKTIARESAASVRERGSRFMAFAWPVEGEEEVKELLEGLRKKYYDATHYCYAWKFGPGEGRTRVNDDGEPSGSAGRPILGQILSAGLSDTLIVVVRWFGGTKLGVPGLIGAYREAARAAIEGASVVEKIVKERIAAVFPYESINGVMKVVKDMEAEVAAQHFDNTCRVELSIRRSLAGELTGRLLKVEGVSIP